MKFRCERDDLLEAVQFASRAISSRATLPVLAGLRVEASEEGAVKVAATDLELTMATALRAAVDEPGRAVLPGRLFGEMSRSLGTGQVSLAATEAEAEIGSGRGQFRVKTLATDDYPALPIDELEEGEEETAVGVDAGELATGLSQVVRAASTDESRQVLTGVLWELTEGSLNLAATDSYRLGVKELEVSGGPVEMRKVVLPARALNELARALLGGVSRIRAELKEHLIVFSLLPDESDDSGRTVIGTRFIEGEFPKYRQLIPEGYTNTLRVEREALLEVVKRVGLLAQNNMPVKLRLGAELEVSAHTPDVGEGQELLDAAYQGEAFVIAFNPQFMLDGGTAIKGDQLILQAGDGLKPAILRGEEGDSFTYLLMPVRLS
jgi:DNA polymerase III subunit beta